MEIEINNILNKIKKSLQKKYSNLTVQTNIAWQLLEYITQKNRAQLIASNNISLNKQDLKKLDEILKEHINYNKPIQYIFGNVPFLDLTIKVKSPILIPRPETEQWCDDIIDKLKIKNRKNLKILDLCTGTGCVGLALAYYLPESEIWAIDLNKDAIELAKENAKLNNIKNINFLVSDLYNNLNENLKFDLITANPPYITESEWHGLEPSVKNWEDILALKANDFGLEVIKKIIKQAPAWLNNNNFLVIEFGYKQADQVKSILENNNFINIKIKKDITGKDRVAYVNFKPKDL